MIKTRILIAKLNYQRDGYTANSTFEKEEVEHLIELVERDGKNS